MTNNTQNTQPTAAQLADVREITRISEMKRDDLRKYAAKIGIKSASKYSKSDLLNAVIERVTLNALADAEKPADEKKTERVRTSHADCKHASTKVARAKCRRERANAAK